MKDYLMMMSNKGNHSVFPTRNYCWKPMQESME